MDEWKGEHLLRGIKRPHHEGAGYNMKNGVKHVQMKKHMPLMIELIKNCQANGYWEETKRQPVQSIVDEMREASNGEWDNVSDDVLVACMLRIKNDNLVW